MSKDDLRPIEIRQNILNPSPTKGYFHGWVQDDGRTKAIVETAEGKCGLEDPWAIKFTDRGENNG